MVVDEFKQLFFSELDNIYTKNELQSIFKILIKHILDYDAADIILNADIKINKQNLKLLGESLSKLKNNEPIQYIVGKTSFFDLEFHVTEAVLIPRPETEELVQWAIDSIKDNGKKNTAILDIGTGSGCIAISLAKNCNNTSVDAMDISSKALRIASKNNILNKTDVHFIQQDILQIKELQKKYDVIISNPPYVKESEKKMMHQNVLQHEPQTALFVPDDNPLLFYQKIGELAFDSLTINGLLFFEINQYLSNETVGILKQIGYNDIELKKDFLGNYRMIKARKKM